MPEQILVTGGAGFIGAHVVEGLLSAGHRVRVLDNLTPQVHGVARKRPNYLVREAELIVGDVRDACPDGPFDAAYVLDVMHHLPREDQRPVLERLRHVLVPGGTLLVKDITTEPRWGLLFTEALDRLMVGRHEPLAYRHHREWGAMLTDLGFKVRMVRVPDVLPYPHVVIAATKVSA